MNAIQNFPIKNVVKCQMGGTFSCKESVDFRKELSVVNSKSVCVPQIKKAYRRMALRYHPDVCDPSQKEESTRLFIELQKAYTALIDQESENRITAESEAMRSKWENQISELNRRSQWRNQQTDGSWASKMRARRHRP